MADVTPYLIIRYIMIIIIIIKKSLLIPYGTGFTIVKYITPTYKGRYNT